MVQDNYYINISRYNLIIIVYAIFVFISLTVLRLFINYLNFTKIIQLFKLVWTNCIRIPRAAVFKIFIHEAFF